MENIQNSPKPFLRWAGGKKWLLRDIHKFLPTKWNNYHEPFIGAGSIFFHIKPKGKSFLSDLNDELINVYIQIKHNLTQLVEILDNMKVNKKEYYLIRKNLFKNDTERAARIIYLNKSCFNGIYRVNQNNEFNVPYGKNHRVKLYDLDNLKAVQHALTNTVLKSQDFNLCINDIQEGDLVVLDPPYTVAHANNGFIEYNKKIFSWEDQKNLSNMLGTILELKANFILTNASHPSIEKLYLNKGSKFLLERMSSIGGRNAKRQKINELIYTSNIK